VRPHGTEGRYNEGCTCPGCRAAHAKKHREYTRRKMAQRVLIDGRLVAPVPAEMHGKHSTYRQYGCKCAPCVEANRVTIAAQRTARLTERILIDGRLVAPVPPEMHDRYTTYQNYGCRCIPCTTANSRKRRGDRKASR